MAKVSNFSDQPRNTVSFAQRLATSENFKALFKEGMGLVEEAASYLDGPGRNDAKTLARLDALAYASESMRLTTRLMQLASWLLLQRAVNEGELTPQQAATDKHKVKLANQDLAAPPEQFARLPAPLQDLCRRSVRLQNRVLHLDKLLYAKPAPEAPVSALGIRSQLDQLRQAFQVQPA